MSELSFDIEGRRAEIFPGPEGSPAIYLNSYGDNGEKIHALMKKDCPDASLIVISGLDWENDMTPWYCPPLSKYSGSYGGKAENYLKLMENGIVPEAESHLSGAPAYRAVAGYSLGGLFAVWTLYRTELFSRAASMSGSLWYPDFLEYVRSHKMIRKPDCLYISVGDREARTRNKMLRTVQERAEAIAEELRSSGVNTIFEMNPGNHSHNAEERTVKGICRILSDR